MKFCPFCLSQNIPPRRKYCCDEHRDATRRQVAREAGQRRYSMAVALRHSIERGRYRFRWRQIALGLNEAEHLAVVFGPKRKRRPFT